MVENWTGECMSITEYGRMQYENEKHRKGQQYILIEICEGKIEGKEAYCNFDKWYYYAKEEKLPENVVILSEDEYIKNEKGISYYRKYKGDTYVWLEVEANKKLKVDKVEEIYGFLLCTVKGKGALYTKEEFLKKFLH